MMLQLLKQSLKRERQSPKFISGLFEYPQSDENPTGGEGLIRPSVNDKKMESKFFQKF